MPKAYLLTEDGRKRLHFKVTKYTGGSDIDPPDPDPGGGDPDPPVARMILGSSASPSGNYNVWSDWNNTLINDGSKPGAANGGLGCRRTFNSGSLPATWADTPAAPDVAAGVASIWSCKPSITAINNGSMDAAWTAFFNSIPAGHRAFLTFWHEPWNDFDASDWSDFRAAQVRVYNLLNDSNADRELVRWGLIGTSGDFRAGNHLNYFPDTSHFDWVGVDGYDYYRDPTAVDDPHPQRGIGRTRTPHQIFGGASGFARDSGKPLLVAEFSVHPDPNYPDGPMSPDGVPSRPYRLQAMLDYFLEYDTVAACLFHNGGGNSGPWWIDCFHNWTDVEDRSATDPATVTWLRNQLAIYGKPL